MLRRNFNSEPRIKKILDYRFADKKINVLMTQFLIIVYILKPQFFLPYLRKYLVECQWSMPSAKYGSASYKFGSLERKLYSSTLTGHNPDNGYTTAEANANFPPHASSAATELANMSQDVEINLLSGRHLVGRQGNHFIWIQSANH